MWGASARAPYTISAAGALPSLPLSVSISARLIPIGPGQIYLSLGPKIRLYSLVVLFTLGLVCISSIMKDTNNLGLRTLEGLEQRPVSNSKWAGRDGKGLRK